MGRGLTVLMYHRVLPAARCEGYPLAALVIAESVFDSQMKWLAARCRVLPLREAVRELNDSDRRTDRPLVAVTFDDGYADNAEVAAPILEKYGLRGTFYLTTGFVETGEPLWFDRAANALLGLNAEARGGFLKRARAVDDDLSSKNGRAWPAIRVWMEALKRNTPEARAALIAEAEARSGFTMDRDLYRPMSRKQASALHEAGHEIASHTVTHPILPQLDDDAMRFELTRSREQLRAWIGGGDVPGFCYPNGDADPRVEQAVLEAGYTYACTTVEGMNLPGVSPTRLMRLPITMDRTTRGRGEHDELGFRGEVSRLRDVWRRSS